MRQYIIDAFVGDGLRGNPAAVCLPDRALTDAEMLAVAQENNLSETSYLRENRGFWEIRWFTPAAEIDFCGHATLAAAFALFRYHGAAGTVRFRGRIGELTAQANDPFDGRVRLCFPAYDDTEKLCISEEFREITGCEVTGAYASRDLMLVLPDAESVRRCKPDLQRMALLPYSCIAVTARADSGEFDVISRVFAPRLGIAEDPVTGSTHCMIAPYWSGVLGKPRLRCLQASARWGVLETLYSPQGHTVEIDAAASVFAESEIYIPSV